MSKQAACVNVACDRKCVMRRWAVITSYHRVRKNVLLHPFYDAYSLFKLLHSSSGQCSKFVAYCYCAALQAKMSVSVFHSIDCFSSSPFLFSYLQVLVWHTRTEKPVLVNEGKKGFTDSNVEIWHAPSKTGNSRDLKIQITQQGARRCTFAHMFSNRYGKYLK